MEEKNLLKRDIKDIIFHEAIATEENLPEIYRALGFGDFEDTTNDLELTTIETLWTNHATNDLSFFSKKDQKMIYLEVTSDWKLEDLERFAEHVVTVLNSYSLTHEDFRRFRVGNEIFILSTSGKEPKKKTFYLSDLLGEDFDPSKRLSNFKFTVISRKNGNVPLGTIIEEFFRFCEIQMEVFHEYGRNLKAYETLLQRCIDENVLKDFVENNRERIMLNLNDIYNQEYYTKKLIKESNKEVEAETTKKVKDEIFENLKNLGLSDKEIYSAVYDS